MKRGSLLGCFAAASLTLVAPVRAEQPAAVEAPASAEAAPLPTIQQRFASKAETISLHLVFGTQVRGDFYHRVSYGAALAYYPWEELGFELRALLHHAWLTDSAEQVRGETGFVPDTRAPVATFLVGGRYSFGYGKVQLGDAAIVHFDPQAVIHLGATVAEEDRVLPTALFGLSVLLHFELGFQAQIELLGIVDLEERNTRGWIASIGFAPFISVGWRFDPEMLR